MDLSSFLDDTNAVVRDGLLINLSIDGFLINGYQAGG